MIGHTESNALAAAIGGLSPSRHRNEATRGTVTRVERSGTVWVRFVGADSDTPCARAVVSAKAGESVTVSVINGRATVTGNLTSPPTDDSTARSAADTGQRALQAANVAGAAARVAVIDAGRASIAARSAETSAKTAAESADSAASDAASAMSSALSALTQLGTVEDVMGTLAWLRDHEVYMPATEFSEGETYFELVDGKYVEVANPVAGDVANYYVYDHQATMANFLQTHLTLTSKGLYITQTKPTEYQPDDVDYYEYDVARSFDPDETYYQLFISESGTWYQQVENPVEDGVGSYYVRRCNAGGIRPMGKGYLLLTDQDVRVFGPSGRVIARYGYDIELGDSFLGKGVAHIDGNSMEITNADISERLNLGNWSFEQRENGNLTLTWKEA